MNKIIISILGAIILSCGTGQATEVVGFLVSSSGLGDQSFNDMTYAGLVQASHDFKFELIREIPLDNTSKNRKISLEKLLKRGVGVVVANGWGYHAMIQEAAKKNPRVKFIIHDVPVSAEDNLVSTVYGQHESSFLAGALAGWMTRTGKIGFIGGENMPIINAFLKGFEEGAFHSNKDINLSVVFLGSLDDSKSGFDNPLLAYKKANRMYENNVDIILTVAGLSGNGVIRAAAKKKKYVIGVDADQDYMAKGYVLTSVMKRLDTATYKELKDIMAGDFKPGIHHYGLEEGGVALSPMIYTKEYIGPEIMTRLKQLEKKIIKGKIVVTNVLSNNY